MARFVISRFLQSVVSLVGLVSVVFFVSRLTGDPMSTLLPPEGTTEQLALLRRVYGLDQPLLVQYGLFLGQAVRGDLGTSVYFNRPVAELVGLRIGASLQLACASMGVALALAVPLGVYAAVRRGGHFDLAARSVAILGGSMPSFLLGLILILVFAVRLEVLPVSGRDRPLSIVLPAITLGWFISAALLRLTRSGMLGVLETDYVRLARIKGVPERLVVWKHAFKNAVLPVVTYSAVIWASAVGGAIVTEYVFAWPGLGSLMVRGVASRDYPMIQGVVLVVGAIVVVANLMADLVYVYLNPRIRYTR